MSRKRRRSQAFAEPEEEEETEQAECDQTEEELESHRLEKELEVWDAVREEHFEVVDQVPLTLHRQYTLMRELDQQTHGCLDDLIPTLQQYVAYRRNLDSGLSPPQILEIPSVPLASPSKPTPPKTPLRSFQLSDTTPRISSSLALPAERMRPPRTGKEMLAHVAWLGEELMSAAQEKVNLAQAAHDYISRQIQVLGQSIKEQEASIALGIRPGTQLAPILLPDVLPPSRWKKDTSGGLVLEDDEQESEEAPTTLGVLVDETDQPNKRPKMRKGKRPVADTNQILGVGRTTSLKITLPAMYDHRIYCYCRKPSEGEMVACDNEECENQWFHLSCTKLVKLPEESETWYCIDCVPDRLSKKGGRRR